MSRIVIRSLRATNARDYPPRVIKAVAAGYSAERLVGLMASRQVLVAVRAGVVVGTASREGALVQTVFVAPEQQGLGIGTSLMAALEKLAQAAGIHVLHVPSSITAEGFYRKLGFSSHGPASLHGDDRLIALTKRLTGGASEAGPIDGSICIPGPVSL